MNWKLIFSLSLFGLAMAFGTVYFISSKVEPFCWGGIMLVSAFFIAKNANGKYFLHGLFTSLANCVWITGAHVALFTTYIASHQEELKMMADMPFHDHPRRMMLIAGPIVGIISGIVLGVLSLLASKIFKK